MISGHFSSILGPFGAQLRKSNYFVGPSRRALLLLAAHFSLPCLTSSPCLFPLAFLSFLLCCASSIYFWLSASAFTFSCVVMWFCLPCFWASCGLSSSAPPAASENPLLCCACVCAFLLCRLLFDRALLYSPPAETRLTVYRRFDILPQYQLARTRASDFS